MRRTKLPKREARQQLLDTTILGIYCYAIAVASAFIGPALFHSRSYNVRGFAILLGLIFGTPAFIIFWWRKSRREKRVEYRRENGICVNCGYDLRGNTTGVCPECGESVEEIKATEDQNPTADHQGHRVGPRSGVSSDQ